MIKIEYAGDGRSLTLKGLKPDSYTITARKPDYQEYNKPIVLKPGQQNVVTITLVPILGNLSVSPSVSGTEIEIFNLESGTRFGHYMDHLNRVEIVPGRYRVNISKEGYRATTREITVKPGESAYLEPQLSPLPTPTPAPTKPFISVVPMHSTVERQGKYFILHLQGTSGELSKTQGSINVTVGGPAGNSVSGVLNGLPCRIQFIQVENVAESAVIEAPGPSNQWARVVVHVRPKDSKQPFGFAINWSSLRSSSSPLAGPQAGDFIEAIATQKVLPNFPAAARNLPVVGSVSVSVTIDSRGSVVSAKAIDGPFVFRHAAEDAARKWKFRPATRDGRAIDSVQIIRFAFQK